MGGEDITHGPWQCACLLIWESRAKKYGAEKEPDIVNGRDDGISQAPILPY